MDIRFIYMGLTGFKTKFFLPSWWVHSYQQFSWHEGLTPFEMCREAGFCPYLGAIQMDSLAAIASILQQQIFAAEKTFSIEISKVNKFNPLAQQSAPFEFEQTLQWLETMKVFQPEANKFIELVESSEWLPDELGRFTKVRVSLTDVGKLAFLGYSNPYFNFLTKRKQKIDLRTTAVFQIPLIVNQSVWLDLQGSERLLMLALEKAMQWDQSFSGLEGSFVTPFDNLFNGYRPRSKRLESLGISQKLSYLRRIGRKLVEHGLIESQSEQEYVVFGNDQELSVLWKGIASQVFSSDSVEYRNASAEYLTKAFYARYFGELLENFGDLGLSSMELNRLREVWGLLSEVEECKVSKPICTFGGSILSAGPLFIEWLARLNSPDSLRLPEAILSSELKTVLEGHPARAIERFAGFLKILDERRDIVDLIKNLEGICLVSDVTLDGGRFAKILFSNNRPSQSGEASVSAGQDVKILANPTASSLKRKAALELARLQKEDLKKYRILRQQYIETLDEKGRKVFDAIEQRMKPQLFEEHIKHSLVRYMMEHPSQW